MKTIFYFLMLSLLVHQSGLTQSTVYLRNNTWNDFLIEVNQHGSFAMDTSKWLKLRNSFPKWNADDASIFRVNRDSSAIPAGDTALFDIYLIANTDTVTLKLMLVGTATASALYYSAAVPGFSDAWYDDGNFHQFQTTLAGKNVIIKYKPDNGDTSFTRNIRFVIHDFPIYDIPV